MRQYATEYGINIVTTSPKHSQANGLAEKAVHIVKNLLRKECNLNETYADKRFQKKQFKGSSCGFWIANFKGALLRYFDIT